MIKVLIVVGTRPEAIKMAPVINGLRDSSSFQVDVCNTGQHMEMIEQVFDIFQIQAKYNFNVVERAKSLHTVTSTIIEELEKVFEKTTYDCVIVHGDTNTCLSTSLAAFYSRIDVMHVEAGLRTGDIYAPWPEEMNRVVVGRLAALHFAPTVKAQQNLMSEGIPGHKIAVTGNTVIDALVATEKRIEDDKILEQELEERFGFLDQTKKLILVTGHRRENFGSGFRDICLSLKELSKRSDVQILYPVHLNPNVLMPVHDILSDTDNVHLIKPVDYVAFVYLMKRAHFILTDSGGIQEEAPSIGVPVLVMRASSERPEALESGLVSLVGTSVDSIVTESRRLIEHGQHFTKRSVRSHVYGDGTAALQIKSALISYFNKGTIKTDAS